jgi:formylmethanofuran dehydrogenase subunit E
MFKILPKELAFYIENHLPIPTKHPTIRRMERFQKKNGRKIYERTCIECHKNITTTYAPDRPEKIVCEECYRKLVY